MAKFVCRCATELYAKGVCRPCYDRSLRPLCGCGNVKWHGHANCWDCHSIQKKEKASIGGPYRKRPEIKARRNKVSKEWNKNNLESVLCSHAKRRAKAVNVAFNLTKDDIKIPEYCPVLGIKLSRENTSLQDNSPTVDRLKPEFGYVRSNVAVISWRANRIKNDATAGELQLIAEWVKKNSWQTL